MPNVRIDELTNRAAGSITGGDLLVIEDAGHTQTYNCTVADLLSHAPPAGSPGGSDRQVQFNNAGAFGGTDILTIGADSRVHIKYETVIAATTTWGNNRIGMQNGLGDGYGGIAMRDNSDLGYSVSVALMCAYPGGAYGTHQGGCIYLGPSTGAAGGIPGVVAIGLRPDDGENLFNASLFGLGSHGGGVRTLWLSEAAAVPASNPAGGGILYVEAGALKYRGPGGTVTTIAAS